MALWPDHLRGQPFDAAVVMSHHLVSDLAYLEALAARDFGAAARCLENLGRHVGCFQKHQEQKRQYTQADVERLRKELEEAGMDFTRRNDPVEHLTDAERAERVASLERKKAEAEERLEKLKAAGERRDLLGDRSPRNN